MTDELLDRQVLVRSSLTTGLERDLIGPHEPDEVLEEAPLARYVTGILYPTVDDGRRLIADQAAMSDVADDDGDGGADPAVAMSNVQYPSSAGITFAVDAETNELDVTIDAARYEPLDGDRWRRNAIGPIVHPITVGVPGQRRERVADGLIVYTRSRDVLDGARSITVVLLNELEAEAGSKDATSFFQVQVSVSSSDAHEAPFVARPAPVDVDDEDLRTNALLYRDVPEFAVGHGCAATWEREAGALRATVVTATFMPEYDVVIMESNPEIPVTGLAFDALATASRTDLVAALESFVAGYNAWINDRRRDAHRLPEELSGTAAEHLAACRDAEDRITKGVHALRDDEVAMSAFQLANRAMADQMERARVTSGAESERSAYGWRPFQLAFVLLALPSIIDPTHKDREVAELLWFPTGGGKTEAYLGLFAFAVFHRRLAHGGAPGVTAIMRYTLRLLTTQQFERASRVVCACERIRRERDDLGSEPISIGLFVGSASTPNTLDRAREVLARLRAGHDAPTENPCQLRVCPWCEAGLDATHYALRDDPRRLHIECRNQDCAFAAGLPIWVVDEDVYRIRPTLVIGTVDKFAALPWRPDVGNLFNLNEPRERPPDLIIQDELHLISGPLGTMTGLYETAIDILCSSNGYAAPKVVASTATIRRARKQASSLFARDMRQFPPPGIDPGDSWFATKASADRVGPRKYVGVMAPGVSHATLLIRAYAALMHDAATHPRDDALDPYWTLIGYFNSLRVLGAARMQVQDDVHDWLEILGDGNAIRRLSEPIELTSRADSADIPEYLKRMEIGLPEDDVLDVVLATNMISVGVDVDRLGLMVVMGQPQAAAEYIQATSRVGRKHPGLVVTLLNAARSRDRSHYEGFRGFHEGLYRSVEATSVTPFSPRARDRGLHAVLVALARLTIPALRNNDDAAEAPEHESDLRSLRDRITARAGYIEPEEAANTSADLDNVIDRWIQLARQNHNLVYESWTRTEPSLLTPAGPESDEGSSYSTMWSLRDVDAESNLFFARLP